MRPINRLPVAFLRSFARAPDDKNIRFLRLSDFTNFPDFTDLMNPNPVQQKENGKHHAGDTISCHKGKIHPA